MKRLYLLAFISIMVIIMAGCKKETKVNDDSTLLHLMKSTTQDDIHKVFGEPTGTLSGFWGDIYNLENGTTIIVYYGETGEVDTVKIIDKEGTEAFRVN